MLKQGRMKQFSMQPSYRQLLPCICA